MIDLVNQYLEQHPQYLTISVILFLMFTAVGFLVRHNSFFKYLLRPNYEKRIARNLSYLDHLKKKKNKSLKRIIKREISNDVFTDVIGYRLTPEKQHQFLTYYDALEDDLTLGAFKKLFKIAKIKYGVINIRISLGKKMFLIGKCVATGILAFLLFYLMILVLMFSKNDVFLKATACLFLEAAAIFFLIVLLMTIVDYRKLMRLQRDYDGFELP